jgi:cytochrome c oxidase assembly factor CtaG
MLALVLAGAAQAHDGSHHDGPGWTLTPWVTGPLALIALLYIVGLSRLWARARHSRASLRTDALFFASGWAILTIAIISPLHEAGEQSFTLHMIEHELIMLPASLLLVLSRPGAALLWGLPLTARRGLGAVARNRGANGLWQALSNPFVATGLQALVLVFWHMPALFDRALADSGWHVAQHLSFLLSALLFWWAMAHGRMGRHSYGLSALCLFITSLIGGLLGALMSLAASPWYAAYAAMGMSPIGLSPIEDQQLAGIIMWIPGGVFHGAAALYFTFRWLRASEDRYALSAE